MRITILRPNTSDFGKVGSYNVQEIGLAKAFQKKGYDVTVLFAHRKVRKIERDSQYSFVYYIPHHSIGLHGIFNTKILSSYNPDLVILFSDNQLWAKNIIQWCKKNEIKCVNYFGAVLSDNPRWINQFYTKLILKRNKKSYLFSSNYAKTNKVKKELEEHKIRCDGVVPIGLDSSLLSDIKAIDPIIKESLGFKSEDKVILFVGRLVEYKKPLFVIDIAKLLLAKDKNYKFVILGKGPLKNQLLDSITNNSLEKNVLFVERIPYCEMFKYYVSSTCFINLSDREIFGMSILEAMYYGVPVVAKTAPGPIDIIDSNRNGILLETYESNKWAEAIIEAENKKEEFVKRAYDCISTKYLWDVSCDLFLRR